jgi:L-lactate dehydrogenase (cytochrome)
VVQRRIPRPGELAEVLGPRPFVRNPVDRRLSRAHTIDDLRRIGRRRTPRAVFDYVDGAAESEASLRRAREAFQRVEFHPNTLQGAADVDLGVTVLGERIALPFAFAPTGFTGMIHHEGESAVVQVAERNGIPYTLSTMGNTSIGDIAAASPGARKWFQLYVMRDRGKSAELMRAAWQAGYDALMLTVDTPVAGARLRDRRHGLTLPPTLSPRAGADAVVLSSHGGRQLDRAPVPLELLQASLDAVTGDAEVWLDTGILSGGDIVAAMAMGADLCLVGRAYLYGLMAGGQRGVQRAVDILRGDIVRTMQFLGVRSFSGLKPGHADFRHKE